MHARPVTTVVWLQVVLATDCRIFAWNSVQKTNRREANVRISVLVTEIDCVEIEISVRQRTFVRGARQLE